MKIFLKIIGVLILIVISIVMIYAFSVNVSSIVGRIQNNSTYDLDRIDNGQSIVFLGDSITAGYIQTGELSPEFQGYRGIIDETLKSKDINTTNYAVGGYTIADILKQLETDVSLNATNQEILNHSEIGEALKETYSTTLDSTTTISSSIADADSVILTVGANDLINSILKFDEDGIMSVNTDNIISNLKKIQTEKNNLFDKIKLINPDIHIYDVGIYFAYPHQSDTVTRLLYPILMYVENIIFIDDKAENIHKITIRDNMQTSIKEFVSNPSDIHPTIKGHEIIANEVLKALEHK